MSLAEKLQSIREGATQRLGADDLRQMAQATAELRQSGIMADALKADDQLPPFVLPNQDGLMVDSRQLLAAGPLVLTLYRGSW
jgi:hypothetical protein